MALALAAGGCAAFFTARAQTDRSSSVVNFLYPDEANPLPPVTIPTLRLPLRVGIAFVPAGGAPHQGVHPHNGLGEAQQAALLRRVAEQFKGLEFIEAIELIPSTYLRPGGSFTNLDQIRSLFRVDVVALVAYDQEQFTTDNVLAVSYWTIVGAYIFPGSKNDTHTMLEAVVYDIPSRSLLFRAPGVSHVDAATAGVYVTQRLREDSGRGFETATDDLIKNLSGELTSFRARLKEAPGTLAQIEHKPGYTGAGATGPGLAAALGLLGLVAWLTGGRARARSA